MTILASTLVTAKGAPVEPGAVPSDLKTAVPDYCSLLAAANGFELVDGLFRVFGVGGNSYGQNALVWNKSSWRSPYGVPPSVVFLGENIFGDQYGVDTSAGSLLLMSCEGGKFKRLAFKTVTELVESIVVGKDIQGLEIELVRASRRNGLLPSVSEHLSFAVPLICGGTPDEDNLEVLEAQAHLDLLGQIIAQTRGTPDGTRIRGFGS